MVDQPSSDRERRAPATPVLPTHGVLRPLGLDEARILGGFWGHRQAVNAGATLAHIEHWLEREGWLGNFDAAAAGLAMTDRRGREFSDSEVYKLLEAMAWELGREHHPDLEDRFDSVVERIAAAQDADGYLGTMFGRPGQAERWADLEWGHELYCIGHLIQAGVARIRTGHYDRLVRVARWAAEHVCEVFGPDGLQGVCGHPEIEVALAELGRALGEPRYLSQAALFVERRGHQTLGDIEFGRAYFQDDVPVRDATVLRGHAVRANYLAAAAVDVAVEHQDGDLLKALALQWETTRDRRTYLTGGQGSRHQDEAFGEDYFLPPDRAYSETCAAIGSVMLSWRLLLATGEPRYADLIERALYNVVATSPSDDGTSFYYSNTLHQRAPGEVAPTDVASARAESSLRAPWFAVSCCPTNVARTFASLSSYAATTSDRGVQLHQLMPMQLSTRLADQPVRLTVQTDYPHNGRVDIRVDEWPDEHQGSASVLSVRVPDWCRAARLVRPGHDIVEVAPGLVDVTGLRIGDNVVLELDIGPRFVWADHRLDAVRGCVAVESGPLVWCLESTDLPEHLTHTDLDRVRVDTTEPPRVRDGRVEVTVDLVEAPPNSGWPYGAPGAQAAAERFDVALTPYHDWASRGPSTMRVWMPTAPS
ncbi:glycoside hydrolase family 127 protein [Nocardioides scoriae]|nr:beta-L-arabinofuranosidase domain-containing protein [Nocardioides scoriae]